MYDPETPATCQTMSENEKPWEVNSLINIFNLASWSWQTTKISAVLKCSHFFLSLLQKLIHQIMSAKNAQALQVPM